MRPEKPCQQCGRPIQWRKKWARDWDSVKYCSDKCRRSSGNQADQALEAAILTLLDARAPGASICPSEAARAVSPEGWRGLMEPVRQAARRLALRGELEITQSGRTVNPGTFRGPIRLRRPGRRSSGQSR